MKIFENVYLFEKRTYNERTTNIRCLNIVDDPKHAFWVVFKSYDFTSEQFDDKFTHFLNQSKKCLIDNSAELTSPDLVDFLIGHDKLNTVTLLTNGFRKVDIEKIDELVDKGCEIIQEDFFIKYGHEYYQPIFTINKPQYKNFLILNGKPKPYRTILTSLLYEEGLDEYGYISYFHSDLRGDFYPEKCEDVFDLNLNEELENKVKTGLDIMGGDKILDTHNFNYSVSHMRDYNADYYGAVDFVVVPESDIEEGIRFITEKTLKVIQQNKKFILLSSSGMLKETKRVYYDLYGIDISHLTDWCDTSYDDITDTLERTLKIKDIISNILSNS